MTEKITPEQVNRMLALNNDMLALRAEGVGIISASPYRNEIHVDTETILAIPGELEVNEREKHEYPFEYVKHFGGKRFFALSKERICPRVEVLA